MKKLLCLLALLIVISMFLTACGGSNGDETDQPTTTLAAGTETTTPDATKTLRQNDDNFMSTIENLFPTDLITRKVFRPSKKPIQPITETVTPRTTHVPEPAPRVQTLEAIQ